MVNELKKPMVVIKPKGAAPGKMETDDAKKTKNRPTEIRLAKGKRELIKAKTKKKQPRRSI